MRLWACALPVSAAITLVRALVQAPALPGAQAISPADRLYSGDQSSNTVTVISPFDNKVLGTIDLGDARMTDTLNPQYLRSVNVHGLGFARDGKLICSVSVTSNTLTVIKTLDNSIVSQTSVGRASHEAMFAADNRTIWVGARGTSFVDIVDGMRGSVIARVPTAPGPSKILFSPDGKTAYTNHIQSPTFSIIDVKSRRVIANVTGLAHIFSSDWMLSADGRTAWLAHKQAGKVSVIDVQARKVISILETGAETNHAHFAFLNGTLHGFVTVSALNLTKVYTQKSPRNPPVLLTTIPSKGIEPHGITTSPDNTRLYVLNEHSDSMDVIDLGNMTVIDTLNIGQEGQALIYVAGAVPSGSGTQNLGTRGLGLRVDNRLVPVSPSSSHGPSALLTMRELVGLDMFQIIGRELEPNKTYVAAANVLGTNVSIPLVQFSGSQVLDDGCVAAPQVLSFSKLYGVYDLDSFTVTELQGSAAAPSFAG